jgi:outer membrane protein assembly factor BamB
MQRRLWLGGALIGSTGLLGACSSLPWSGPQKPQPAPLPLLQSNPLRLSWRAQVGANPRALPGFTPGFAGNVVAAASPGGLVSLIDAVSGALRWQQTVARGLAAGAATDGAIVVVASADAQVIAFDMTGKRLWATPLGAACASVPVVGLDIVLVRSIDGRIQALDARSGQRRWQVSRQAPSLVLQQTNSIAMSVALAYVGLPGGRLAALSLESGAVRWEAAVSQPRGSNEIERIADVTGSPLVSDDRVCAASFQGRVGCFDASTGRALWVQNASTSSGLELDGRLVTVVDDQDRVLAYSRDGALGWRTEALKLRQLSGALSLGRYLLVGDAGGLVHAINRDDGKLVGRASTDGSAVLATPVAAGRLALVQTRSGGLFALGTES